MSLLFSFYGDDFTGSTDVMESLALHGVRTVLFTRLPSDDEIKRFEDYHAIGIAGTSRSQTPAWMDENLPRYFSWLKHRGAEFCQYKVCSTFDSSPMMGNIGRAIEIGRDAFKQAVTPLVVGAPQLKRYTAFGHLFAAYQGLIYRIDRHPVMSRHPVTPMDESDLRMHLSRQTLLPTALIPLNLLAAGNAAEVDAIIEDHQGIVLFDVLDGATQIETGRHLLRLSGKTGPFVVGSSGVSYALLKALVASGSIAGRATFAPLEPVGSILAVSGSCSPTTARQIHHALANGFVGIAADPLMLAGSEGHKETARLATEAIGHIQDGRSVIVYTALDPDRDTGTTLDQLPGGRHRVGEALGQIARQCIIACSLKRAIFAGGDTSSHALGQLDLFALTTRFPLATTPGSPLCIAHSADARLNGVEIAMKGGQVGSDDYFTALRDGTANP
jgi:3-oxoisoapionate kinase